MRTIILLAITSFIVCNLHSQTLSTTQTSDWNKIYQSGFYESITGTSQNNPAHNNTKGVWFWGINTAHKSNGVNYRFNGQILFQVNMNAAIVPSVYLRSTNQQGKVFGQKFYIAKATMLLMVN